MCFYSVSSFTFSSVWSGPNVCSVSYGNHFLTSVGIVMSVFVSQFIEGGLDEILSKKGGLRVKGEYI